MIEENRNNNAWTFLTFRLVQTAIMAMAKYENVPRFGFFYLCILVALLQSKTKIMRLGFVNLDCEHPTVIVMLRCFVIFSIISDKSSILKNVLTFDPPFYSFENIV